MRVKDIAPGPADSLPFGYTAFGLTIYNNALYFAANDGASGAELWKSDGTAAGTVRVKDISSPYGSSPSGFTVFNGMLYFRANDGDSGLELWTSDGTDAGTVRVKDINPGYLGSSPYDLTVFNNALYFSAFNSQQYQGEPVFGYFPTDREPWKTDGTEAGTVRAKDINPGNSPGDSDPKHFTVFGGALYFSAYDGVSGYELWKTDGTESGTVRVKDINRGAGSSSPGGLTVLSQQM